MNVGKREFDQVDLMDEVYCTANEEGKGKRRRTLMCNCCLGGIPAEAIRAKEIARTPYCLSVTYFCIDCAVGSK